MGKNREQRKAKQSEKRSAGSHCAVYSQKHIRMKAAANEAQQAKRRVAPSHGPPAHRPLNK
jgi:hypothetical protein